MVRRTMLSFVGAVMFWPLAAGAQPASGPIDPIRVGDRWLYEWKDELSGEIKGVVVQLVTEVSEREIVTTINQRGNQQMQLVAFDHNWDRVDDSIWRYKPNDGMGIRPPLAVGKEWRFENHASHMQTGAVLKTTGSSKVVAQETVTTPAGTFDTFKIETRMRRVNTTDMTRGSDTEYVTWYAPQINHWVRTTFTTRIEGRTRTKQSNEVIEFSRKE